jgi:transposase
MLTNTLKPSQAILWKREFLANAAQLFDKEHKPLEQEDQEKKLQELYVQIDQLKVENDFLKKN